MGKLIGENKTNNVGEKIFVDKAIEYLDDNCIIYRNRQIFGREFDVCVLLPGKGVLIVELKGWKEESILRVENNEYVVINTDDGEILASPQKQARGYRFSVERLIRQSLGKFPLVFQMVSLPQVSKEYYHSRRLDVVMEERYTFLKEDLSSKTAFFNKLDQALRESNTWHRDEFDSRTMLEVRNLFETDVDLSEETEESEEVSNTSYRNYDYSRFYYFNGSDDLSPEVTYDIADQYMMGCKLYCVVSKKSQMKAIAETIDAALSKKGLMRNRENVELIFDENNEHTPKLTVTDNSFTCFHCSVSITSTPTSKETPSFVIKNGEYTAEQEKLLKSFGSTSPFNPEQYFIEHAPTEKNIVIKAGAGTGKTYTMISRIGFICYAQNVPLQNMADRIVMITFTNDAADQMEDKLKTYYRNCYLITSRTEYLAMISQIDSMQISTIHSYAKNLISRLGTSFGYGIDVGITSSEFYRRKKISDILDSYIQKKKSEYGESYTQKLGMPVYAIRDSILDFIGKLHNKSIDILSIQADDFGNLGLDNTRKELHELLATVIPSVEREYFDELLENNRIHLSSMMSVLNRFVNSPDGQSRICELRKSNTVQQFMFVDEFQDTDDTQIDTLLLISCLLDYRLFLVGDIKQCIYRFRGAKEKAFDQLKIEENPNAWLEFSLQRNYRTDSTLLRIFDKSFSAWGSGDDELLTYDKNTDCLIGTKEYNSYLKATPNRFYKKITITGDEMRIPALVEEIKRIQKRISYEETSKGIKLSPKERSIAILVRENWQAEMIRVECGRLGISIHTNTGGDLYMSQPALDMLTLVNALVHFDEADYLYNLVTSNFFNLDIPKSNLFEMRMKIRTTGWRSQVDEHEQVTSLINFMNLMLANTVDKENKWEYIVASLRTKPVLQALRKIYSTLEPWRNFSDDSWKQHYYQLNVDMLFEELINACNVDRLTINTLQEYLYNCIVSQVSVDSRVPESVKSEIPIQCITVHKSKGLEYGHVILPFCSNSINHIKRSQLHVSTTKNGSRYNIGYSLSIQETNETVQNNYYDEVIERSEKSREETRILYVAMTRSIRSFSWIGIEGKQNLSWQNLIEEEV